MKCLFCYKLTSGDPLTIPLDSSTAWSAFFKIFPVEKSESQILSSTCQMCRNCEAKLAQIDRLLGEMQELKLKIDELQGQLSDGLIRCQEGLSNKTDNNFNNIFKIIQGIKTRFIKSRLDVNNGYHCYCHNLDFLEPGQDNFDEIRDDFDDILENTTRSEDYKEPLFPVFEDTPVLGSSNIVTIPFPTLTQKVCKEARIILEPLPLSITTLNTEESISSSHFDISKEPIASFIRRDTDRVKVIRLKNVKLTSSQKKSKKLPKSAPSSRKFITKDCSICGKSFNRNRNFTAHMRTHTGEFIFCDKCPKYYTTEMGLGLHQKIVHSAEADQSVKCLDCDKTFKNLNSLKVHERRGHGQLHPCSHSQCTKVYKTKFQLKDHINNVHNGYGRNWICEYCSKVLSCRANLNLHILHVHQEKKYTFFCPEPSCSESRGYTSKIRLKEHTRVVHKKIFSCSTCLQKFSHLKYLQIHVMAKHTGVRPCICQYCSKGFLTNSKLKRHESLHLVTDRKISFRTHNPSTERKKKSKNNISLP